jgi:3-(methylthio)propionyl---CoA ligase
MMTCQLTTHALLTHAARYHQNARIVSLETDGQITTSNWPKVEERAKKLAQAVQALGATPGSRRCTLAWNNLRHLELYFALSGAGLVCHTVNPRLSPEHISYIINHAKDEVLFIDETFVPLVAEIRDQIPCVRAIVLMGGVLMGERRAQAAAQIEGLLFYDELIAAQDATFDWPDLDENSAAGLCYTSGTTGQPKGGSALASLNNSAYALQQSA